jgi:dTDP-glucose 4,6-dehydratase
VYGDPEYLPIDEDHDLNGNDPYSRTKQMTESLAWTYNDNYDLNVTATRNFNTFGPRHSKDYLIPTLLYQAINENKIEIWSETTSRDFIFIDDMVEALLTVAASDAVIGEPINIGTGNEWTSKELADLIAERFGGIDVINLEKDTTGSDRLVCENTKLQTTTDWEPAVSFEDGLDRTVEWYREHWEN